MAVKKKELEKKLKQKKTDGRQHKRLEIPGAVLAESGEDPIRGLDEKSCWEEKDDIH